MEGSCLWALTCEKPVSVAKTELVLGISRNAFLQEIDRACVRDCAQASRITLQTHNLSRCTYLIYKHRRKVMCTFSLYVYLSEVGKQLFKARKSANCWAHSAIANPQILQARQSENRKCENFSGNPQIAISLLSTKYCTSLSQNSSKSRLCKVTNLRKGSQI